MQSRPRFWITAMIGILAVAFLIGFAPIRLLHGERFAVDSNFAYQVGEVLYEDAEEIADLEDEIAELITEAGLTDAEVEILGESLLTVETFAYDQDQADSDRQVVLKALNDEFDDVRETTLASEEEQEQPVATWGPFAVFAPRPQLRLGLDLQGGAHVVLRCLSSAEMSFVLPEDKLLVTPEDAEPGEDEYRPPFTEDQLVLRLRSLLQDTGADPDEVGVSILGNHLLVDTRPEDQRQVTRQQDAIYDFLVENYPGLEIEKVEPSAVFVDDETADKVKYIIERRLFASAASCSRCPGQGTQGPEQVRHFEPARATRRCHTHIAPAMETRQSALRA